MAVVAARAAGTCVVIIVLAAALGGCGSDGDRGAAPPVAQSLEVETGDVEDSSKFPLESGLVPVTGWSKVPLPKSVDGPHLIAAWTGSELLLWGSQSDSGVAYNLETGGWRQLAASPWPAVYGTASAWTDDELIVYWGDQSPSVSAYDWQTDVWRSLADAPITSVSSANALWSGTEVLLATESRVAVYRPEIDAWELGEVPPSPLGHSREAAWTGAELVVWPTESSRTTKRGLAYNPIEDTWRTLPDPPAWPAMPDVVWTGEELITWGGLPGSASVDYSERAVGSSYDPATNAWTPMPETLPDPESYEGNLGSQTLIWTGAELIVSTGHLGTGLGTEESLLFSYQPRSETWELLGISPVSGYNTKGMVAGNRLVFFEVDGLFVSEPQWGFQDSGEPKGEAVEVASVVEPDPVSEVEISGVLPNGDRYVVRATPELSDTVEGTYAVIVIDLDDGEAPIEGPVAGVATFHSSSRTTPRAFYGRDDPIVIDSGNWFLVLDIYDHVYKELGESAKSILLESIIALDPPDESGLPAFELRAPLRWADDYEVPSQMMVSYPDFVVRRGCSNSAVACSPDESVEVVPKGVVVSPHPEWPGNAVEITRLP